MHQLATTVALFGALTVASIGNGAPAPQGGSPDPPKDDPATTVIIDKDTLRSLAEQSLTNNGLSLESHVGDLWSGIVSRTEQTITLRQHMKAMESSMRKVLKELESLRTFVGDHAKFGDDFSSYQAIIAETRKLTEAKVALKRQQEQFERARRREETRQKKEADKQKRQQSKATSKRLEKLGFSSVGEDVYLSKSAYAYAMRNVPEQRVFYQPGPTGEVQQLTTVENREEIDYTKMTISGSLLNAAAEIRNIGVAFVFRDTHGNQIGQETVIVENARPEIPYPFTGELVMAS
ncbi:MAG: hypothetical protein GY876_10970, partial [Planctomycetes bacterium]|nr:hypothetical protein [Planctomycetota bacterium]